ncbi:MAG: 6-pyruvoyl-tetrahydropterin synthase-related protein [Coprococcus sp.]
MSRIRCACLSLISGGVRVVTQYDGIVIGDYADGIPLAFPSFKAGMSSNIEDYSTDELKSYHTVILTDSHMTPDRRLRRW